MDTFKHSAHSFHKARGRQTAFTLVEVTMSIGIVAFAMVSTLGLLPTGLNTFRRAMEASVGSQIAQRVIDDAQQTDFDVLTSGGTSTIRYFDDQGTETSTPQTATYWVNTRVVPATTVPVLSGIANPDLATVNIQVVNNPGHAQLAISGGTWTGAYQNSPSNAGAVSIASYWTLVSRNQ